MSGKLHNSPLLRGLMLSIRKAPSDATLTLLESLSTHSSLSEDLNQAIALAKASLSTLLESQRPSSHPLRSADDALAHATLRTTVVAQKVSLSKQRAALSSQDTAYTALVREFAQALETSLAATLVAPHTLPFHEVLVYDLRSPQRESRNPRPRHAVERALAAPHDYLDCACCRPRSTGPADGEKRGGDEGGWEGGRDGGGDGNMSANATATATADEEEATLAASQPATAVLYQLYLESGGLINVSDLWQAFRAVIGTDAAGEEKEQAEEEAPHVMALFQRALAELRYLGFVKGTRKRVDHVAKVAWRGL